VNSEQRIVNSIAIKYRVFAFIVSLFYC